MLASYPAEQQMLLRRSPSGPKKYFPIPVEHLEHEIRIRAADDGKLFREEFNVSLHILYLMLCFLQRHSKYR